MYSQQAQLSAKGILRVGATVSGLPIHEGSPGDGVETRLEEGAVEAKWQQEVLGQQWVLKSLKLASGENLKELSPPPGSAALAPDPAFMQVLILGPCHPRGKDKRGRLRGRPLPLGKGRIRDDLLGSGP